MDSEGIHLVKPSVAFRVPVEIIFDQGIGDLFSVRVAGNVVSKDVLRNHH